MRFAVNARPLQYAAGGVKEYLAELLCATTTLAHGHEIVSFTPKAGLTPLGPGLREEVLPSGQGALGQLRFDWWELPKALKEGGFDAVLYTSSAMPAFRPMPCNTVLTVHDCGYLHSPSPYRAADTLYFRLLLGPSARTAHTVICVSEATKLDLCARTNAPSERCRVVHLAAPTRYAQLASPDDVSAFQARHGLRSPYLLYVGNVSPRKNLSRLLCAMSLLGDDRPECLVLTGSDSWNDDLAAQAMKLGLQHRVIRLGYVPSQDMPSLYRGARAVVFPSSLEGFGLPALEAQSCDTPVALARASSLPEVGGQGAVYFDPLDPNDMAQSLRQVLDDETLRSRLRSLGRENLLRFDWRKTAQATLDALCEAASAPRP